MEDKKEVDVGGNKEVVIKWVYLEKVLEEMRVSIFRMERVRLERIYREFVDGRSGEMKDG